MTVEMLKDNPVSILTEMVDALKLDLEFTDDKMEAIKETKSGLLKLSPAEIKEQMDLMFETGKYIEAIKLLFDSGVATTLFKNKRVFDDDIKLLAEDVKTIDDFYSIICYNDHKAFKKVLGGSTEAAKGIKAIGSVFVGVNEMSLGANVTDEGRYRLIAYDAMRISDRVSESGVIPGFMQRAFESLDGKEYPKSPKDFIVKAKDLKETFKLKDSAVKDVIQDMVIAVMLGKFPYDKEVLMEVYRRGLLKD